MLHISRRRRRGWKLLIKAPLKCCFSFLKQSVNSSEAGSQDASSATHLLTQILITARVRTTRSWRTQWRTSKPQSPGLVAEEALSNDRQKKISAEASAQTRWLSQRDTRVHLSQRTWTLIDITDAYDLSYLRGPSEGWVWFAVRTYKLLKNVVYSFHWLEFKPSSVGLTVLSWGSYKTHKRRSFPATLDASDTYKNMFGEHTSCRIFWVSKGLTGVFCVNK